MKQLKQFWLAMLVALCGTVAAHAAVNDNGDEYFYYGGIVYEVIQDKTGEVAVAHQASYGNESNLKGEVEVPAKVYDENGKEYIVTRVNNQAFYCAEATVIKLPESVKELGAGAFQHCHQLTEVAFNGVEKMGSAVFFDTENLKEVKLPSSLKTVSQYFLHNSSIKQIRYFGNPESTPIAVNTENGTMYGEEDNFVKADCAILFDYDNPESISSVVEAFKADPYWGQFGAIKPRTFIDGGVTYNIVSERNATAEMGYGQYNTKIWNGNVAIPDVVNNGEKTYSIVGIGGYAFYTTAPTVDAVKTISIPETVTNLGFCAFNGCTNLERIYLPNGIERLEARTFEGCSKLKFLSFGNSIKSIDFNALNGCDGLKEITITATTAPELGFQEAESFNAVLHVPAGTESQYTGEWAKFKKIVPYIKHDGLYYNVLSGNTVELTYDLSKGSPEYAEGGYAGIINVPASFEYDGQTYSVVGIGDHALQGTWLSSVTLPEGITYMGDWSLAWARGLESVTIPSTVKTIGEGMLYASDYLKTLEFRGTIEVLPEACFAGCPLDERFIVSDNVKSIGHAAFNMHSGVKEFVLGSGLQSITGQFLGKEDDCILEAIKSKAATAPVMSDADGYFDASHSEIFDVAVYVPVGSTKSYRADEEWNKFKTIIETDIMGVVLDKEYAEVIIGTPGTISATSLLKGTALTGATWTSSDETIATVSGGIVTGFAEGEATITATVTEDTETFTAQCTVVVKNAEDVNTLAVTSATTSTGEDTSVDVTLANQSEVIAVQCDIVLPEGVTVKTNNYRELDLAINDAEGTGRSNGHAIYAAQLSNGNVRVIIFSSANNAFKGNSGTLFTVPLEVSKFATAGDLSVSLTNVTLVTKHDIKNLDDANSTLGVTSSYTPGDANGDGKINVADATIAVSYILQENPQNLIFGAADMNNDGKITIADVTAILSIVLSE